MKYEISNTMFIILVILNWWNIGVYVSKLRRGFYKRFNCDCLFSILFRGGWCLMLLTFSLGLMLKNEALLGASAIMLGIFTIVIVGTAAGAGG